jgi:ssRNA-specific RNase YbeY (16S rRNA maturation enzyme)
MSDQNTISFISEDISFDLEQQNVVQNWINEAIVREGKITGEITFIFCSDNYLHLLGYDDKTDSSKKVMRSMEDFYLSLLSI